LIDLLIDSLNSDVVVKIIHKVALVFLLSNKTSRSAIAEKVRCRVG